MGTVRQCDKCKDIIPDGYINYVMIKRQGKQVRGISADLCDKCMTDFDLWIQTAPIEED